MKAEELIDKIVNNENFLSEARSSFISAITEIASHFDGSVTVSKRDSVGVAFDNRRDAERFIQTVEDLPGNFSTSNIKVQGNLVFVEVYQ